MSDQHFNQPVNNVAAHQHIEHQHNYAPEGRLLLGPQKWVSKRYVASTSITSGWLAFSLLLAFMTLAISSLLLDLHALVTHSPTPRPLVFYFWLVFIAAFALITGIAGQISSRGFIGISHTRIGIARDIDRHVFIGELGGRR